MAELPFKVFDADNHYYEATDAFIRHIDPAMKKRCMQWADIDGKQRLLVAGKVNRFIPNPDVRSRCPSRGRFRTFSGAATKTAWT